MCEGSMDLTPRAKLGFARLELSKAAALMKELQTLQVSRKMGPGVCVCVLSCSVAPFFLFFGGCPTKMVFPKRVPFFSRVTEQLSVSFFW